MLSQHTTPVVAVARVVVSLSWAVFGLAVALRAVASRRAAAPGGALIPDRARAGLSRIGIALQGVAFALVWARSPRGGALLDHGPPVLGAALPALAGVGAAVGVAAVWLGVAAIRVLG